MPDIKQYNSKTSTNTQTGSLKLQDKVVSSESEKLILVDESDNEVGYLSKAACHDGAGLLHRAFSVFIFNANGQLLLQQRGKNKRLWPEFWSNSCCSHPRQGESMQVATERRLLEELGVAVELDYVYKFRYQVPFGDQGSEHELCSVYLGRCTEEVRPNVTEIEAIRFVSAKELDAEFDNHADSFTPWFKQEWTELMNQYKNSLSAYLSQDG
jgi:isopentenyl-diphosphate delta-isomerase